MIISIIQIYRRTLFFLVLEVVYPPVETTGHSHYHLSCLILFCICSRAFRRFDCCSNLIRHSHRKNTNPRSTGLRSLPGILVPECRLFLSPNKRRDLMGNVIRRGGLCRTYGSEKRWITNLKNLRSYWLINNTVIYVDIRS